MLISAAITFARGKAAAATSAPSTSLENTVARSLYESLGSELEVWICEYGLGLAWASHARTGQQPLAPRPQGVA